MMTEGAKQPDDLPRRRIFYGRRSGEYVAAPESVPSAAVPWRTLLLWVLVIGEIGILVELLLLGHDDDRWQLVPLALAGAMLLLVAWYLVRRTAQSVWAIGSVALLSCLSAALGIFFHYRANVEWELETTPEMHGWELFREVVTGALPLLAPGAMLQLGLIGLIWCYRHPQLTNPVRSGAHTSEN